VKIAFENQQFKILRFVDLEIAYPDFFKVKNLGDF
jgi:hypothetical protein